MVNGENRSRKVGERANQDTQIHADTQRDRHTDRHTHPRSKYDIPFCCHFLILHCGIKVSGEVTPTTTKADSMTRHLVVVVEVVDVGIVKVGVVVVVIMVTVKWWRW